MVFCIIFKNQQIMKFRIMKRIAGISFILCALFVLSSCAPTKETVKTETETETETETKDSLYVFDEATTEPQITGTYYLVQVGAFTTQDKAELFAEQFTAKMNKQVSINYNKGNNLFVVQLIPKYKGRPEAEAVRDLIKQQQEYSDVWILTVNK